MNLTQKTLTLFLSLSALISCSKKELSINPSVPTWVHRPSWSLQLSFRNPLVGEPRLSGAKAGLERSVAAIDPKNRRIFIGTSDHGLYALRADSGSILWRFQTAGSIHSEAFYSPEFDIVYFGSDDDAMYALHAHDGSLAWRYKTGAQVQRKPILAPRANGKPMLVFNNAADCVFAVDALTGTTLWKRVRTPALGFEIAGHAGVSVDHDRVYTALSTGKIVAYDLETGTDKWPEVDLAANTSTLSEDEHRTFDTDTTPIVRGDRVYVANIETGVYALDVTAGAQIWRRPEAEAVAWLYYWSEPDHATSKSLDLPQVEEAGIARTLLLAGSGTTGLWALDPKTGEVRWRKQTPYGSLSSPIAFGGALLVSSAALGLFLIDTLQGRVIDGLDPGTGYSAGAAVFGNRAFVLNNAGTFIGLDILPPHTQRKPQWGAWLPAAQSTSW